MSTKAYAEKRDFSRTPEPSGGEARGRAGGQPIFVIQQHDASSLHYDFRLEIDGRLVSWAVPKGPSTDPRDKRLAILTEDHPLDYADFEGVIPAGEYGAGTVLVWDTGPFDNITEQDGEPVAIPDALEHGHIAVRLHGKKLQGGWALQRMGQAGDARWLLVKMDDEAADARRNPVSTEPRSVLSDRTIEAIAAADRKGEG